MNDYQRSSHLDYTKTYVQPKSHNRKRTGMKPGSLVASAQDEKELLILYRAIKASKAATAGRASALRALVEAIA